jgi:hypothetical protein
MGCSSHASRRGARNHRQRAQRVFRPRALHSALLGPCCSEKQFPELPPSTEAGAIKRTVLASKEATPPQGVRGEGRQTAWLLGVISRTGVKTRVALVTDGGGLRHRTGRAELATDGNIRGGGTRWRAPRYRRAMVKTIRGDTRCASSEWARPATVVSVGDHREISRQRATARRGQTRTEAGASRGGGFTARGRARASNCVAEIGRQSQAQRSPFETPGDLAAR